jgi:hypothetical protein
VQQQLTLRDSVLESAGSGRYLVVEMSHSKPRTRRLVHCIVRGCSTHQTGTVALSTNAVHGKRRAEVAAIIILDVNCMTCDVVRCERFLENDSAAGGRL